MQRHSFFDNSLDRPIARLGFPWASSNILRTPRSRSETGFCISQRFLRSQLPRAQHQRPHTFANAPSRFAPTSPLADAKVSVSTRRGKLNRRQGLPPAAETQTGLRGLLHPPRELAFRDRIISRRCPSPKCWACKDLQRGKPRVLLGNFRQGSSGSGQIVRRPGQLYTRGFFQAQSARSPRSLFHGAKSKL